LKAMKADLPWQSVWFPFMNTSAKEYYSYNILLEFLLFL
jgi:hypothetical protein